MNAQVFYKTIANIAYSELIDDMHYDEDYTRQVYGEQNKVVEEYKKMLEAEAKREAAKQKEYERLMKIGLKAFTSKKYIEAREYYEAALELYPEDINALKKIKAIEDALKDQEAALALEAEKQKEANFDNKIKEANVSIASKNYIEALALLNEANTIIPEREITTSKINEVNNLINLEKQLNANYISKLQEAENAYINKNYKEAVELYKKASELKPKEIKPKEEIAKIEKIIENFEAYNSLITKGDEKFSAEKYNESIYDYEKALSLIPNDENAKSKILAAKEQIALLNEESDKLAKFNKYNKQGDNFYNVKDYDSAITSYNKALEIKEDAEIVVKIENAKSKIEELNKNKSEEEQFNLLVQEGDNLYNTKDLNNSKAKFIQALEIRPEDKAVKSKLALINELLSNQEKEKLKETANLEKETNLINEAETALSNKNYEEAIILLEEAKKLNTSNSSNINEKIKSVELEKEQFLNNQKNEQDELAKNNNLKAQQQSYISKADSYFQKGNYQTALSYYQKANDLGSNEYITNQINLSNKKLTSDNADIAAQTSIKEDSYEAKLIKRLEAQKKGYQKLDEKTKIQDEEKIMTENINIQQKQESVVEISDIEQKTIEQNQKKIDEKKEQISEINENEENFQKIKENNSKLTITKAEIEKKNKDNIDHNYEKNLKEITVIENNYETSMESLNSKDEETRIKNEKTLSKQYNNSIIDDNISENDLKIKNQKKSIEEKNSSLDQKNEKYINEQSVKVENYKDSLKRYSSSEDPNRLKNSNEIELRKKEINEKEELINKLEAQKRIDAEKKLNSNEYNSPVYNGEFKSKLAQDFPEGKTESVKEIKNETDEVIETITTVIIVKGNIGTEYKKTESKWGVMYFKNGNHITKNTFNLETSIRKD